MTVRVCFLGGGDRVRDSQGDVGRVGGDGFSDQVLLTSVSNGFQLEQQIVRCGGGALLHIERDAHRVGPVDLRIIFFPDIVMLNARRLAVDDNALDAGIPVAVPAVIEIEFQPIDIKIVADRAFDLVGIALRRGQGRGNGAAEGVFGFAAHGHGQISGFFRCYLQLLRGQNEICVDPVADLRAVMTLRHIKRGVGTSGREIIAVCVR